MRIPELNEQHGIDGLVRFETGNGGLTRVVVTADAAYGEVYLHGAHVTAWQPHDYEPVLWMSQQSWFAADKPIRGGVPICFPWFGPKPDDRAAPAHGTARLRDWDVAAVSRTNDGGAQLRLTSVVDEFHVELAVSFESSLQMSLKVTAANTVGQPQRFEEALHTYFAVSDVRQVEVRGLGGAPYIDKVQAGARQPGAPDPIRFQAETDRLYNGTTAAVTLDDPGLNRRITIEKTGSQSTVVWNPWINKSKAMPDFGDEEWPGMCCIETVNAGADAVTLEPGKSHTMTATISVSRR